MEELNIYPENDIHEHEGANCICEPYLEMVGDCLVIIHIALDGRRQLEEAYKIINK
tara:strand:- start:450 stop:617 length:168 start_codon:yes stop_codon:yes gene_type:complete